MFLGNTLTVPNIVNLPGQSGGGSAFEYTAIDNNFSMDLDTSGYMEISDFTKPYIDAVNSEGQLSFVCWIKTGSLSVNYYAAGSGTLSNGPFTFQFTGKNIRLTLKDSSAVVYTLTGVDQLITDADQWFHCAFTWNSSNPAIERMKVYVNGVPDSEQTNGPADIQSNPLASFFNANTLIGRLRSSSGNVTSISIDEAAFFTKELSQQTIQAIYDATANNPGKVADLSETPEGVPYAWYRMGD